MQGWDEILRSALLGTERQPPAQLSGGDAFADALACLPTDDREGRLLAAAGMLAVCRRAGMLPGPSPAESCAPAPEAARDLPRVNAPSSGHLAQVLADAQRPLLSEWLELCAAAGRRAPEACLPDLLDRGHREKALRPAIAKIVGLRGGWLAGLREEWSYAGGAGAPKAADPTAGWETGTFEQRLSRLAALRTSDPARGRELVQSTWKQDPPAARAAFLEDFGDGLNSDDEPFLEACLADPRKEVRTVAVALLVRLPSSQLVERMRKRLQPLFAFEAGKKGVIGKLTGAKGRLAVALPKACDPEMQRDGVAETPPAGAKRIGQKQWWLRQLLAGVPPETWCAEWKLEPAALLALVDKTDFAAPLRAGLAEAALRARDENWAQALLCPAPGDEILESNLFDLLAPPRREAFVRSVLKAADRSLDDKSGAIAWLTRCTHAWSEEFSEEVLDAMHRHMVRVKAGTSGAWHLRAALHEFALRIPPRLAAKATERWKRNPPHDEWQKGMDEFFGLLQFREAMQRNMNRE